MSLNKKRLQFDFTKKAAKQLDDLVDRTDATSRAEVIRKALKLYSYMNEKLNEDYEIYMVKPDELTKVMEKFMIL